MRCHGFSLNSRRWMIFVQTLRRSQARMARVLVKVMGQLVPML